MQNIGHTRIAIDVSWCSIRKPQHIGVETQNTVRSGAIGVWYLQYTYLAPAPKNSE